MRMNKAAKELLQREEAAKKDREKKAVYLVGAALYTVIDPNTAQIIFSTADYFEAVKYIKDNNLKVI